MDGINTLQMLPILPTYISAFWYLNTFCELWLFKTKDLWLSYARGRSISEILKLMSAEWTSGEEHMWVITWRRRQPPLWQGSLLDPLQNKSNSEGDLKKCNNGNFTGSSDRSEVCRKRLVHTWRELLRHSFPPTRLLSVSFHGRLKRKCRGCIWFASNRAFGSGRK